MRLAVKATTVLLVSYTLFIAVLGYWLERSVRALSKNLTKNTARVLATDIAAAITLPVLEQLQHAGSEARERLEAIIDDVTERSEVLASLTVVDEAGRVVAGDEAQPNQRLDPPAAVFSDIGAPELVSPRLLFKAGAYYLYVPLVDEGRTLGYLRLGLSSPPLVSIYYRSREEFLALAGLGFVFVLLLGLALQLQLTRRGERLADAVHAAVWRPRQPDDPGDDDLRPAVTVARRAGRELAEARERALGAERQCDALSQATVDGVLLLGAERQLEYANAAARRLFGRRGAGELEAQWGELRQRLAGLWDGAPGDEHGSVHVETEVGMPPRRLRFEISEFDWDGSGGYRVVVRDAGLQRAVDRQLGEALQMRALRAFYDSRRANLRNAAARIASALEEARVPGLAAARLATAPPAAVLPAAVPPVAVPPQALEGLARQIDDFECDIQAVHALAAVDDRRESIELGELVEDVVALTEPAAAERSMEIEPRIPGESIVWTGSRRDFVQALLDLSLYAIDAAPAGGRVLVELDCEGVDAVLTVGDGGQENAVECGDDVFEPVIVEAPGSSRVGLRVAQAFASAYDGRLESSVRRDGGVVSRIVFPLSGQRGRLA